MINGLYSGASALNVFSRQQELVASNLAHLNTPGHRRMLFSFQENSEISNGQSESRPGTSVEKIGIDFTQGRHEPTGRKLDVAIHGDGFFTYQGESGELFSRSGALFRSPEGQLVNSDGLPILDNGSPIVIPPEISDFNISIDGAGTVLANGSEIGQLTTVQFDNNQLLTSEGQTYFQAGDAVQVPAEGITIVQGARELSNAHPVTELISLIIGSRHFESAQRAMRTISETIQENVRS